MKSLFAYVGLVAALVIVAPAWADDKPETAVVSLSGVGEILAVPDMATIRTGVVMTARTAKEALAANTERMSAVLSTISSAGVEDRDVTTGSFEVSPVYDYSSSQPVLTGYQVRNNVVVTVRELDDIGAILDAVVSSGSNQVDSLTYDFSNRVELEDQARRAAVDDVKRKLRIYTDAAGVAVVRLLSLDEAGNYAAPQVMAMSARAESFSGGAPVPMSTGERSVTVTVNTRYQIMDLVQ